MGELLDEVGDVPPLNRTMTVVWGTFMAEAVIRVVAAYTLSTSTVVGLSAVVPSSSSAS